MATAASRTKVSEKASNRVRNASAAESPRMTRTLVRWRSSPPRSRRKRRCPALASLIDSGCRRRGPPQTSRTDSGWKRRCTPRKPSRVKKIITTSVMPLKP
jgi:hypothetical protein